MNITEAVAFSRRVLAERYGLTPNSDGLVVPSENTVENWKAAAAYNELAAHFRAATPREATGNWKEAGLVNVGLVGALAFDGLANSRARDKP